VWFGGRRLGLEKLYLDLLVNETNRKPVYAAGDKSGRESDHGSFRSGQGVAVLACLDTMIIYFFECFFPIDIERSWRSPPPLLSYLISWASEPYAIGGIQRLITVPWFSYHFAEKCDCSVFNRRLNSKRHVL